jgi:hypothetical protein
MKLLQEAASLMWSSLGSEACDGYAFAVRAFLSTLALLLLVALAPLWTLLDVDTHPLSISGEARVHGRADAVTMACKFVLVAAVSIWPHNLSTGAAPALVLTAAMLWASTSLALMPFHSHAL